MRSIKGEALRFLVLGIVNTSLTYLIYLAFLEWTGYKFAFSISFAVGILIAFVLNSLFVFGSSLVWSRLVQYPAIYIFQYIAGLTLLEILVEYIGLNEYIAPFINIIILTSVTFFLNKWFLVKKAN